MSIVLVGSSSGSITLQEPAVAGTTVLNLPAVSGTVLTSASSISASTITGTVAVANGGTGLTAVGTSGNVLTSNGTAWVSSAPSGGVTSLNGQTGAITNTDLYAIGSYVTGRPQNTASYGVNNTVAGSILYATNTVANWDGTVWSIPQAYNVNVGQTLVNTGTWRCVSAANAYFSTYTVGLWVRIS